MTSNAKAHITFIEGHWQHKVTARRISIPDAYKRRYKTHMTIFIPKLTPSYQKPCVFFHLQNKYSSCYFRAEHPLVLASYLDDIANTLRSNSWLDKWERINETSEWLIVNDVLLDEDYLDMPLFKQEAEEQQ